MSRWFNQMEQYFMRPRYISDWNVRRDFISVYVGHQLISRGTLHAWLAEHGTGGIDYITTIRPHAEYTYVEFTNPELAFLFKMQFINEKNYKDFSQGY